jgi:hypothetical protein
MKLDEYMPEYCFSERHQRSIAASPEVVYPLLKHLDLSKPLLIKVLLKMRSLFKSGKRSGQLGHGQLVLEELPVITGFMILDQVNNEELVIGRIGRFWRPDGGVVHIPVEDFKAYREIGFGKVAWNFYIASAQNGKTILTTETRIHIEGKLAKLLFTLYWMIVRPFSGLIRIRMLKEIERQANIAMRSH